MLTSFKTLLLKVCKHSFRGAKYHLDLIIAHQYIEQLDETVAAAVFGNVGTLLTFRISAGDAETLVKEFEPVFTERSCEPEV